jgi:hypothetical protein
MVVLERNPLENIRDTSSVAFTVLNGRVYDAGMNEIAPRQRPRAPFWFAGADGEALPADTATESEADGDHGHADECPG